MIDNKNILYYSVVTGVFILLKLSFIYASNSDLVFLLKPTNFLIEFITNSQPQYLESNGYFYQKLNILIDKSCSGYNFWLVSYVMLAFLAISVLKNRTHKTIAIPLFLLITYLLTIFVNSSRILISVVLRDSELIIIDEKPVWLHQLEGSFVYLFFLICIYLIFERLFKTLEQLYSR